MVMKRVPSILLALAMTGGCIPPSIAQQRPPAAAAVIPAPPYAEVAGLVLAAPVIVDAAVHSVTRIKGPEAVDVRPGHVRLYVEADVLGLLRGTAAVPAQIGYVIDLAADSRGNPPRLRKLRVLLFARATGNAGQIQLVRPDAQRAWSPALDALTRRIAGEVLAADAPPAITGIGNAFHVAGALPGEGETQVFLTTTSSLPVSLSIVSAPDRPRSWSVALSEIVDQAAPPPARDTLLWYRLACSLPPTLPDSSLEQAAPDDAAAAREDYRFVLASLGGCDAGPGAPDPV